MVKFFDGANQKASVEAVMNHVNLYLNSGQSEGGETLPDVLMRRYEELTEYIEWLNGEFDIMQAAPIVTDQGIKGLVKKVVAKCVGWYMKDMNKRQTDFNMHLICALNSERAILEELIRQSREG